MGGPEQIVEVTKELGVSEHTFGRWRNQREGMKADDVKEFRRLTDEKGWLKRMVADQTLNTEILKEIARENSEPAGGCSKKPPPRSLTTLGTESPSLSLAYSDRA